MTKRFHDTPFDDATQLKLELFRRYIRNWIPVFLTRQKDGRPNRPVHIFDFFAGPGRDSKGAPGSPLIVAQELQAFCESNAALRAEGPSVTLHYMFKQELVEYVQSQTGNGPFRGATNGDLFELTCRLGFLPTHTTAELKALQSAGRIDVVETGTGKSARKGAFYVSWNEYRDRDKRHRVTFRIPGDPK